MHVTANPFLDISRSARLAVIIYFIVWKLVPSLALTLPSGTNHLNYYFYALLSIVVVALTVLPFFLNSLGGMRIGWLHPIIFLTLFQEFLDGVKDSYGLLFPVSVLLGEFSWEFSHEFLGIFPESSAIAIETKSTFIEALARSGLLLGFAGVTYTRKQSVIKHPSVSIARLAWIAAGALAAFAVLVQERGGVSSHFASLAYGRAYVTEEYGHLLIAIRYFPYVLLLSLAAKPALAKSVIYWLSFFGSLSLVFLATGSRTGVIWPLIAFTVVWALLTKQLPIRTVVLFAIVGLLSVGALGELRGNAGRNLGHTDFSVLTNSSLGSAIDLTKGSLDKNRGVSGAPAVLSMVPSESNYLYGSTYVGSIFFFVPRSLWPNKPRSAGAYVGAVLYERLPDPKGYLGTGYPIPAAVEAFWNFSYPGSFIVFLFFGVFLKWVTATYTANSESPFYIVLYVLTLTNLSEPGSVKVVPFIQAIIFLWITWMILRKPSVPQSRLQIH